MKQPRWVFESDDPIVVYLRENNIPVTRANYLGLAYFGDVDPEVELDAELEADLPEQLQLHMGEDE